MVRLDATDERQAEAVFDQAIRRFGAVDILMSAGGVDGSRTPVADLATEVWDHAPKANLCGYSSCRRFIQARRRSGGGGRIINISSAREDIARAGTAEYCAAKGGGRMRARTLRRSRQDGGVHGKQLAPR
jgi:glucose 1-dehydrogenase